MLSVPSAGSRYAGSRKPKGARGRVGLATRDFLHLIESAARKELPPALASGISARVRFSLLQLHFGDPTIHYEVWVQRRPWKKRPAGGIPPTSSRDDAIEIGLHFEGPDGARNRALLQHMVARGDEVMDTLGLRIEPEEWTTNWARLHETVALTSPLDSALAAALGQRLAAWVLACQPVLAAYGERPP
ncbi:MAG: hypothetical protein HY330_02965 [Chloroflexi bacterium]|nr:hypothetical protein [Chloroflexota bacterium]